MNKEQKQKEIERLMDEINFEIADRETKIKNITGWHNELLDQEQKKLDSLKLKLEILTNFKIK